MPEPARGESSRHTECACSFPASAAPCARTEATLAVEYCVRCSSTFCGDDFFSVLPVRNSCRNRPYIGDARWRVIAARLAAHVFLLLVGGGTPDGYGKVETERSGMHSNSL